MTTRSRVDALALLVATLGGAGRFPFAPGTAGTLAALPLAALAARLLTTREFAASTAALALVGVWAAGRAATILGQKDPGAIVIDEAAGLCVSLLGIPLGWGTLCGAFLLFRTMDVLKPPPAARFEDLPGGWGIVADDLVAGLYANLCLRILIVLGTSLGR